MNGSGFRARGLGSGDFVSIGFYIITVYSSICRLLMNGGSTQHIAQLEYSSLQACKEARAAKMYRVIP